MSAVGVRTRRLAGDYLTDRDVVIGRYRYVGSTNTATSSFIPAWSGRAPGRLIVGTGWPENIGWRTSFEWPAPVGWEWTGRYNWPAPTNYLWPRTWLGLVPILQTEHTVVAVASDYFDEVSWLPATISAFEDLLELDPDDSWHSRPNPESVAEALTFFGGVLPRDAAPPSVAPLSDGGVQIEWHRGGLDVEVIFSPDPDERGIYVRDHEAGTEEELPLTAEAFSAAVGNRLSLNT